MPGVAEVRWAEVALLGRVLTEAAGQHKAYAKVALLDRARRIKVAELRFW